MAGRGRRLVPVMDLGIHVPIFDIDGGTAAIANELANVGSAVEASGATWLSFMDHFFQIEPTGLPAEANMLEGYTTLGYLAAHTSDRQPGSSRHRRDVSPPRTAR